MAGDGFAVAGGANTRDVISGKLDVHVPLKTSLVRITVRQIASGLRLVLSGLGFSLLIVIRTLPNLRRLD